MTYDEIVWKISDSPLLLIGQLAFTMMVMAFFAIGFKFFWVGIKFIYWYVDRMNRIDREHEEWLADQKENIFAQLMNPVTKAENALEKETFNKIYGEKKNGRSLFNLPDFEKAVDSETDIEYGRTQKQNGFWKMWVRTYWDSMLTDPTKIGDKLVYTSQPEAEQEALLAAKEMGMGKEHVMKVEYDTDDCLDTILVEWLDDASDHDFAKKNG